MHKSKVKAINSLLWEYTQHIDSNIQYLLSQKSSCRGLKIKKSSYYKHMMKKKVRIERAMRNIKEELL